MSQRNPGRRGFYGEGDDDDGGSDDSGGESSGDGRSRSGIGSGVRGQPGGDAGDDDSGGGSSGGGGGSGSSGGDGRSRSGIDSGVRGQPGAPRDADPGGTMGSGRSRSGIDSGVRGQPGAPRDADPGGTRGRGRSRSGIDSGVRGQPGGGQAAPPGGRAAPSDRGPVRDPVDRVPGGGPSDQNTNISTGLIPTPDPGVESDRADDLRREVASGSDLFDPDDVRVTREDGQLRASVPEDHQRAVLKQRAAASSDRYNMGDIRVRETEDGRFETSVREEAQRRELSEEVAGEASWIDDEDVAFTETEDGGLQASVPNQEALYEQHLEEQAAEEYGVGAEDIEASQQTIPGELLPGETADRTTYTIGLTDEAAREQAREEFASQIEGASASEVTVTETGSGGYEVDTVSGEELIGTESIETDDDRPSVTDEQFSGGDAFGQTTDPTYGPNTEQPAGLGEVVVGVAQKTVDDPAGYVGGGTADFLTETQFVDVDQSMRSSDLEADIADRLPGPAGDAAGYVGRSIDEGVRQFDQAAEVWDESVARGAEQYEEAGVPRPVADFVEDTGRIMNPAGAAADTVRATEAGAYVAVGAADGAEEFAARADEAVDHGAYYAGRGVEAAQEDPSIIPAAVAGGAALGLGATGVARASRAGAASVRAGRVPGRTIPSRARSGVERARSGAANVASRTRSAAGEARARSPVGVEIDPDAGLVEVSDGLGANAASAVRGAGGRARSAAGSAASRARRGLAEEPEPTTGGSSLTGAVASRVRRSGAEEDAVLLGAPRTSLSDRFVRGVEGRAREAAQASIERRQRDLGELRRNQDPVEPYEPLQGSVRIGSRDWASIPREAAGAARSAAPSPIRAARAELRSTRFRGSEVAESGWFREMDSPPTVTGIARSAISSTGIGRPVRAARAELRSARLRGSEVAESGWFREMDSPPSLVPETSGNLRDITIRIGRETEADDARPVPGEMIPDEPATLEWTALTRDTTRTRRPRDRGDTDTESDAFEGFESRAGESSGQQLVQRAETRGQAEGIGREFDLRGPLAGGLAGLTDTAQPGTATQSELETTQSPTLDVNQTPEVSADMESDESRDLVGTTSFTSLAEIPTQRQPMRTGTSTRTDVAQRTQQRLQQRQRTARRGRPRVIGIPLPDFGGPEDEGTVSYETDAQEWETPFAPPSAVLSRDSPADIVPSGTGTDWL